MLFQDRQVLDRKLTFIDIVLFFLVTQSSILLVAVILAYLRSDLQKEMAAHSSILAWRIPWTEEPGRPWSKGSQRLGHD